MITREFNLNLHAGHSIPLVINVSQYESNEQWLFTIINQDGTQYRPASASIVGTKSDGYLIDNEATVDNDGRVVVEVTEQIAAAAGKAVFELRLDDQTHGTANFVVLVEKSPADEGIPSESDLSLIQQAIDGTSATAIAQGVSDWMDDNLTPTTPVVDQSLTVQGAAADSKKVGDELSDLKSEISSAFNSFKNFLNHLNASFDDENGDTYIQEIIDAIDAIGTGGEDDPTPPTPEEPTVELVFCETPFSSSSTHLYTDEGSTSKTDLKTSNGIYYYLEDATTENTVYNVKISVNTNLNSHQYKAMYAYSAELLSGAGTNDPTIYNITNLESAGIFDSSKSRLTEDSIYETQMTVKAGRQLAVLFYRNQSTCINSITAQKVVS